MKASRFTEAQKAFILKQGEQGTPVAEICRKAGISQATYLNGCERYVNRDSCWDQGRDVIAFPPISFRGSPRLGSSIQDTFVACC